MFHAFCIEVQHFIINIINLYFFLFFFCNIGNQVILIAASDADASAPNNILSYSIDTLSASTFSIDGITGIITLSHPLDREQNDHYEIIVTVSDKGNPVLTNTTVVNIAVIDVNDEKPHFHTVSF